MLIVLSASNRAQVDRLRDTGVWVDDLQDHVVTCLRGSSTVCSGDRGRNSSYNSVFSGSCQGSSEGVESVLSWTPSDILDVMVVPEVPTHPPNWGKVKGEIFGLPETPVVTDGRSRNPTGCRHSTVHTRDVDVGE